MKRISHTTVAACLLLAGAAHAQMFKCVTPTGKVEYRGSPCADEGHAKPMTGGSVSGVEALSPAEMDRARALEAQERRQAEGGRAAVIGSPGGRPSAQELKNLETAASSTTVSAQERRRRQLELEVAREKAAGGTGQQAVDAAQADEQQRRARRQARQQAAPKSMVNCDGAGCWDTAGNRYNRAAGQGNYTRQDGKVCATAGTQVTCN